MQAIDNNGNPIPWLTYPLLEFIKPRLNKSMNVYEYGSGNSTLWFSNYVGSIESIEHDKKWYELIKSKLPDNATITYRNIDKVGNYEELTFMSILESTEYSEHILMSKNKYNIIVVDGVNRNNCILQATKKLTKDGVIILDNLEYKDQVFEGLEYLKNERFKVIEFWGISPIAFFKSCTAIFYKDENCLGI
nr:FkbM family methyltransferase [uncultured Arsenicibacter sp.]